MATAEKPRKRRLIKKSDQSKIPINKAKKAKTLDEFPIPSTKQKDPEQQPQQDDFDDSDSESDSDSDSDSDSGSDSDSDSGSDSDSENLSFLLEPYTKDQLIELICNTATKDSALLNRIRELADRDVCHRKIFVHGLSWDTTKEALIAAFEPFGEIEECNLVLDKNTGKAKGYGFVLFRTRRAAIKALRNPQKKIMNRMAACQLASVGPASASASASASGAAPSAMKTAQDASSSRKIYVSNVPTGIDVERFRAFFAKFGEIETGPIGFDVQTGKSRGFALFVYKTQEGFKKALQEPYKLFEGQQLHCQKAAEGKSRNQAQAAAPPQVQPQPHPAMMAAVPQNLGFFNPMMYGGFIPGTVNPMALNPGMIPTSQIASLGGETSSVLGTYVPNANTNASLPPQVYPSATQFGQPAASASRPQGTGGTITGYPSSYAWYDMFSLVFFASVFYSSFVFHGFLDFLCLLAFCFRSVLIECLL